MRGARALLGTVLLAWGLPAAAAPGSLASACQLDFQLFCSELDPESPRARVAACLRQNAEALTEECRAVLDPASVPRPPRRAEGLGSGVCQEDFRKLCGHEADRMAFARCVRSQRPKLSPACRDALDAASAQRGPRGSGGPRSGHGPGRP